MSNNGFKDLREALKIFEKYADEGDKNWPTEGGYDKFYVHIEPHKVSEEDKERLDELGFIPDTEYGESFISHRFG